MPFTQDALAAPEGTQLPSEAWRSDCQGSTEVEPLYPWFFTAVGLERVPPPDAKSPSKRGGRDRGRGAGRVAGRVRRSDSGQRSVCRDDRRKAAEPLRSCVLTSYHTFLLCGGPATCHVTPHTGVYRRAERAHAVGLVSAHVYCQRIWVGGEQQVQLCRHLQSHRHVGYPHCASRLLKLVQFPSDVPDGPARHELCLPSLCQHWYVWRDTPSSNFWTYASDIPHS